MTSTNNAANHCFVYIRLLLKTDESTPSCRRSLCFRAGLAYSRRELSREVSRQKLSGRRFPCVTTCLESTQEVDQIPRIIGLDDIGE